jgi:Alpha galactosidase C-terminal beta sandwich domain/Secretion system C-terminal sorting domain
MAGGPLSIADQFNTIGNDIWLYQNSEVLFLNADKFVGKPQSNNPTDERSEIWTGQMSNGNWIIGLFNRGETTRTRSIAFSTLGITDSVNVRDLWQYGHLGKMKSLTADIPPHGCLIATTPITCPPLKVTFDSIPNKFSDAADFAPIAISNIGQPISFEIAAGPATIVNNKVHLTGGTGTVHVVAKQQVTTNHCAALPKVRSFEVLNPRPNQMFVAGTFNNWTLGNNPMGLENNTWVARNVAMTQGNHEMKFANTVGWTGSEWGNATGSSGIAKSTTFGAPSIKFTVNSTGVYTIYFNDVSLAYSIVSALTNLETPNPTLVISLSPNPVQSILSVKCSESMDKIALIDVTGKMILTKNVHASTTTVDVAALPKGMYCVQIFRGEKMFVKKVLIE